jgi:hypothetical protein
MYNPEGTSWTDFGSLKIKQVLSTLGFRFGQFFDCFEYKMATKFIPESFCSKPSGCISCQDNVVATKLDRWMFAFLVVRGYKDLLFSYEPTNNLILFQYIALI